MHRGGALKALRVLRTFSLARAHPRACGRTVEACFTTSSSATNGEHYNALCKHTVQQTLHGAELSFSCGGMGILANSSVLARHGDTVVHCAVTFDTSKGPEDSTFVPVSVDYREKAYARGVIPRTSLRKERHQTEEEVGVTRYVYTHPQSHTCIRTHT
jgi:hypothetical protein